MTELQRKIIELYPHHSAKEVAEILGCSKSYLLNVVRMHNVQHTEETKKRIWENVIASKKTEEFRKKISVKRKRMFRMEYARMLGGMEQRTNLQLRTCTMKQMNARRKLFMRFKYFGTGVRGENLILLYDDNTLRMHGMASNGERNPRSTEDYYTKKYGFTFINKNEYHNGKE